MTEDPFYISELLWETLFRELTTEEFAVLKRWFDTDPVAKGRLILELNDLEWIRKNWADFNRVDPEESWKDMKALLQSRQSEGE
jgi:hypothetical protein